MVIIGLTGGIASGKSTVADLFRRFGIPVISADALVHDLQDIHGAAVNPIGKLFPDAVRDGKVDRRVLASHTLGNRENLKKLEAIMHPLVRQERRRQLAAFAMRRTPVVVLEIPLLFETGAWRLCDLVVTTSAPVYVQKRRAMQRPHMTEEKFEHILKHQLSDNHRRRHSAFIVHTGRGRHESLREVKRIIHYLKTAPSLRWRPGYGK